MAAHDASDRTGGRRSAERPLDRHSRTARETLGRGRDLAEQVQRPALGLGKRLDADHLDRLQPQHGGRRRARPAGNPIGGLSVLTPQGGSLAQLPLSMLNDGPWCGSGQNQFDADLLRVKKVRATIRVQASQSGMRSSGADYAVAGTSGSALRSLPDYTLQFEVSPRNMNLGR
jgi:hypothetical protein